MMKWEEHKIEDLCDKIVSGGTPLTSIKKYYQNGNIPWIKTKEIKNNRIFQAENFITKEALDDSSAKLIPINSIIIAMYGDGETAGKVAINKIPLATNQACCNLILNKKKVDCDFLFYLLQSNYKNLVELKSGGAQQNLNAATIREFKVSIPKDVHYQESISKILVLIDDKILLLKEINNKFGLISDLIFNSFFLRQNQKFSPGNFGEIVSEITTKIGNAKQSNYKVLSAVSSGNLIPSEDYFSKQVYSKDLNKYKTLEQFDFAYNPARVNIGSIGMLDKPIKGCVSPVYIAFRTKPNWHYFVDLMIKQPHIRKTIEVYCSGSVRQVLRFEDFCRIEIKLPPEKKVLEFNEVYQSILNKINHDKQQIEKLTTLRDTILPKLMTGKIEIKN